MPSRRRALVLEVYAFHKKGFYKRGGEEYLRCVYGQQNSRILERKSMRVELRRVVVCYM